MDRPDTRAVGQRAEHLAFDYLAARGLRPVARNFRCRLGELDLVMLDGTCLVFIEVRYRSGQRLAPARLTVDARKQAKLVRAAAMFASRRQRFSRHTMRFDVVGVDVDSRGRESIEWLRDAFRPADSAL